MEDQCRPLEEHCLPRDLIFVDRGVSGTVPPKKRPGFRTLLDRIGRDPETRYVSVFEHGAAEARVFETIPVVEDLERRGIMVWSLSPNESFTRSDDRSIRQLLISILS